MPILWELDHPNDIPEGASNLFDDFERHLHMSLPEETLEIRENDPIPLNEFENMDLILYGCFPTLFLFGEGLPSSKSVSDTLARQLLLYHDNRFAENIQFIFYLFNAKMRHIAISNTSLPPRHEIREFTVNLDSETAERKLF